MKEFLSPRGQKWARALPPLVKAHFDNFYNLYDKETNPEGLINMGTAESHLVNKEVCALMQTVLQRVDISSETIHYNKFEGAQGFREAIAKYWQNVIFGEDSTTVITADNLSISSGCTVALEMLATLLAEPGDVFLVPAPYYSSFVDDVNERQGVEVVGVTVGEDLDREAFERAMAEQTALGKRVRAVLFSSPNNPMGTVYKPEALNNLIAFAMAHDLDIISDEIYGQTVFDPEATYVSTLQLVPKGYLHRVHVTSSFAKDFVLSGFKVGICISFNPAIVQAMSSIMYFSPVSNLTQLVLTELLEAPELPEVMALSRQRLAVAYEIMSKGLADMGVATIKAQAGMFLLADFSAYLETQAFEAEQKLWEKIYNGMHISISPGEVFGTEKPGWFRICYAFPQETVEETCQRLATLEKH